MKSKSAPKTNAPKRETDSGTLVRISRRDKDILQELSNLEGEPMPKVLRKALEVYRRQKFLDEVNNSYAILKTDPNAWQVANQERDCWDSVLVDAAKMS